GQLLRSVVSVITQAFVSGSGARLWNNCSNARITSCIHTSQLMEEIRLLRDAERPRSPAAAAGETLNSEKPKCRRGQVQRLARRATPHKAAGPPRTATAAGWASAPDEWR